MKGYFHRNTPIINKDQQMLISYSPKEEEKKTIKQNGINITSESDIRTHAVVL